MTLSPEDPQAELEPVVEAGQSEFPAPQLADPETPPKRIPNMGHALLFVSFSVLLLMITELVLLALGKAPTIGHNGTIDIQHPKLQLASQAVAYLFVLLAAWLFFPVLWKRPFLKGIGWNGQVARVQLFKLVPLGFLLGALVQLVTYFISAPKTVPINEFFTSASDAWLITAFGTLLAPLFEEICFRGFLVPAFAIAYDWLSLPKTAAARSRWQTTSALTPISLIFSAILTSVGFALLHAQQVASALPVMLVLFSVSLILTFVRVRTQSVAASTIVHSAYNFFVFVTVIYATGGYRHLERMTK
jgi:uncharacterized protein